MRGVALVFALRGGQLSSLSFDGSVLQGPFPKACWSVADALDLEIGDGSDLPPASQVLQVGAADVGRSEMRAGNAGALEEGATQVRTGQVHSGQVRSFQVGIA